jgi:hypothetical protein
LDRLHDSTVSFLPYCIFEIVINIRVIAAAAGYPLRGKSQYSSVECALSSLKFAVSLTHISHMAPEHVCIAMVYLACVYQVMGIKQVGQDC